MAEETKYKNESQNGGDEDSKKSGARRILFPILLALLAIGIGYYVVTKIIYAEHHEETDDAQIDATTSPVIPRIAGYVTTINFDEYKPVKTGDTIIRLDDRDLKIKVLQAQAALDNASATLGVSAATVNTASSNLIALKANVDAANIKLWQTKQDFDRYQNLLKDGSITEQQFDNAKAAKDGAQAALDAAQGQLDAAQKNYESTRKQVTVSQSGIESRRADLAYAQLQLSYTNITAPATGIASKKDVELGQFVSAGQPLLTVVDSTDVYVIANLKETQIGRIKLGMPVEIVVDAFSKNALQGYVSDVSAATGAHFSLLPPDNATGNFVKVVQRIPVKIRFKSGQDSIVRRLRPGMSVDASVKIY